MSDLAACKALLFDCLLGREVTQRADIPGIALASKSVEAFRVISPDFSRVLLGANGCVDFACT